MGGIQRTQSLFPLLAQAVNQSARSQGSSPVMFDLSGMSELQGIGGLDSFAAPTMFDLASNTGATGTQGNIDSTISRIQQGYVPSIEELLSLTSGATDPQSPDAQKIDALKAALRNIQPNDDKDVGNLRAEQLETALMVQTALTGALDSMASFAGMGGAGDLPPEFQELAMGVVAQQLGAAQEGLSLYNQQIQADPTQGQATQLTPANGNTGEQGIREILIKMIMLLVGLLQGNQGNGQGIAGQPVMGQSISPLMPSAMTQSPFMGSPMMSPGMMSPSMMNPSMMGAMMPQTMGLGSFGSPGMSMMGMGSPMAMPAGIGSMGSMGFGGGMSGMMGMPMSSVGAQGLSMLSGIPNLNTALAGLPMTPNMMNGLASVGMVPGMGGGGGMFSGVINSGFGSSSDRMMLGSIGNQMSGVLGGIPQLISQAQLAGANKGAGGGTT